MKIKIELTLRKEKEMDKKNKFPPELSREIVNFLLREYKLTLPAICHLAKMSEGSLAKIKQGKNGFTDKQMIRIGMKYSDIRDMIL